MTRPTSTLELLAETNIAAITTVMKKRGFRNIWMNGPRPVVVGQRRIAGPAFTMRFIPTREDISVQDSINGPAAPRTVMEKIPEGSVVVIDAMAQNSAGVLGDILSARMMQLKLTGLITDGAMRDLAGLTKLGWPVWSSGISAPPSTVSMYCADFQTPIACGGVAVFPKDIVVADDDGAVVIPAAIAKEVAEEAFETAQFEDWVYLEVTKGASLDGLYPPNEATKKRYEASRSK